MEPRMAAMIGRVRDDVPEGIQLPAVRKMMVARTYGVGYPEQFDL
jgi:hypothetical protein